MMLGMFKKWIPNFQCNGCGSSLGKWKFNKETGRIEKLCFVCCAGEFELNEVETDGEDYEQIMKLTGRESGHVSQILPKINTPSAVLSHHVTNPMMAGECINSKLSIQFVSPDYHGLTRGQIEIIEKLLFSRKKKTMSL